MTAQGLGARRSLLEHILPSSPQIADIDFSREDFSVGPQAEPSALPASAGLFFAARCSRPLRAPIHRVNGHGVAAVVPRLCCTVRVFGRRDREITRRVNIPVGPWA